MTENPERYSVEQALEEAQTMRELIESEPTPEIKDKEAVEKIVDIYTARGLKFRDTFGGYQHFLTSLDVGILTPSTEFVFDPSAELDIQKRRTMRDKVGADSHKANVFDPEGTLEFLREVTTNKEPKSRFKEEMLENKNAVEHLRTLMLYSLSRINASSSSEQWELATLRRNLDDSVLPGFEGIPVKTQEIVRKYLEDPQSFERLRLGWLKAFHDQSATEHGTLQPRGYKLSFGFVLGPNAEVEQSYNGDFPTQGTITSTRIKPRDIQGIYINPNMRHASQHITDDAVIYENPPERMDILTALKKGTFKMPEQPSLYAAKNYGRAFVNFLKQEGYSTEEAIQLVRDINGKTKELDSEALQKLDAHASAFIEEFSPVKSGESLYEGLIREAEKHQLPVYTTDGAVLWPKPMRHQEVSAFVSHKK